MTDSVPRIITGDTIGPVDATAFPRYAGETWSRGNITPDLKDVGVRACDSRRTGENFLGIAIDPYQEKFGVFAPRFFDSGRQKRPKPVPGSGPAPASLPPAA